MSAPRPFTGPDIRRIDQEMRAGFASNPGRDDVRHVCPECGGGPATSTQSGLILVEICWGCQGKGTLSDEELDTYVRLCNHRAQQ